jgi:hypothetical protein
MNIKLTIQETTDRDEPSQAGYPGQWPIILTAGPIEE